MENCGSSAFPVWMDGNRPPPRIAVPKGVPLDEILCAGTLVVERVAARLGSTHWKDCLWAFLLLKLLVPKKCDPDDQWFATRKSTRAAPVVLTTSKRFRQSLERLRKWGVIDGPTRGLPIDAAYTRYFEVLKTAEATRAIFDCREANDRIGSPPGVRFATLDDVWLLIGFFPNPVFVSMDFRHFFYQIPLDVVLRHLFVIHCGASLNFIPLVWPMGFSWSPTMAQSLSTFIVIECFLAAGLDVDMFRDNLPTPSPIIVARNSAGRVVALAVIWYDNILIATCNKPVADKVARCLKETCARFNLVIKNEVIEVKSNTTEFLGLYFESRNRAVTTRHCVTNIARWDVLKHDTASARDLARIIGVVVWDWTCKRHKKDAVANVLKITSEIGTQAARSTNRDWWDAAFRCLEQSILFLRDALDEVIANIPFSRELPSWGIEYENLVYITSDASAGWYGGLLLETNNCVTLLQREWFTDEAQEHINFRETRAAIRTIAKWLEYNETATNCLLIVGVDNTCAVHTIQCGYFPASEDISVEIINVSLLCRERAIGIEVIHVPGVLQPADEITRGKKIDIEKVKRCKKFLEDQWTIRKELSSGFWKKLRSNVHSCD